MKDDRQCSVCKHPARRLIDDMLRQHEANPKSVTLTHIINAAASAHPDATPLTKASLSRYKNRPPDEEFEGETESGEVVKFKRRGPDLPGDEFEEDLSVRSALQLIIDYGAAAIRRGVVVPGPRDMADAAKVLAKLPPDTDKEKDELLWGSLIKKKERDRKKRTRTREVTVRETFTETEADTYEEAPSGEIHEGEFTVEDADAKADWYVEGEQTEREPAQLPKPQPSELANRSRPGLAEFARRAEANDEASRGALRSSGTGEEV